MTRTPQHRRAKCSWLPGGELGEPDGSVAFDDQRHIAFDLRRAPRVGIADIAEVIDYRIAAIAGSISYHVRFQNGGELNYAFNSKGELLELWGKHVNFSTTPEGNFLFEAETKPRPAP